MITGRYKKTVSTWWCMIIRLDGLIIYEINKLCQQKIQEIIIDFFCQWGYHAIYPITSMRYQYPGVPLDDSG